MVMVYLLRTRKKSSDQAAEPNEPKKTKKQILQETRRVPKKKSKSKQSLRERKRLESRKRRAAIKEDPQKHEKYKEKERTRWAMRKLSGKVKTISQMSDREKRAVRQIRKISARKHRDTKRLEEMQEKDMNTPQALNLEEESNRAIDGRAVHLRKEGKKKRRRASSKMFRELTAAKKKLAAVQKKYWREKMRNYRAASRKKVLTPRSRVRKELRGRYINPAVRRKLVFHEALQDQLKDSASKLPGKEKQFFYKALSGKILKRYRMLRLSHSFLNPTLVKKYLKDDNQSAMTYERKSTESKCSRSREVVNFFLQDDVSAKSPDKKAYKISYRGNGKKMKMKKRKRILCGTLKDLYSKYKSVSRKPVSYTTFCRFRPFYVVSQKISERDTCLCKKCENFQLKVTALHKLHVIEENTSYKIILSVTCDQNNDKCLSRECDGCKEKTVSFSEDSDEETLVPYSEWIKNQEKKIVKEEKGCPLREFKEKFLVQLRDYLMHHYRHHHQHRVLKEKRENLGEEEVYMHFDFSENYGCKYGREIQSMYYGGNREEITLHTGVMYTNESKDAFCTLSQSPRHDASAILAHEVVVLKQFEDKLRGKTKLHLQSDSPVTQYRNKDYFFLTVTLLPLLFPQFIEITHYYTEAGHGKGGPDGTGGWAKSTADQAVACGGDISTFEKLVSLLKEKSKKTFIGVVPPSEIEEIEEKFLEKNLEAFNGTMKAHQFTWKKADPHALFINEVSCFTCPAGEYCQHFNLPNSPWVVPESPSAPSPLDQRCPDGGKSVKKGDWISVAFDQFWYPGYVERTTSKTCTVNFMVRHQKRDDLFLWPPQPDVKRVDRSDIMGILPAPPVPVDRHHFSVMTSS